MFADRLAISRGNRRQASVRNSISSPDSATRSKISRVSAGRPGFHVSSPTCSRILAVSSSRIPRTSSGVTVAPVLELRAVVDPLPDLGARDLGGGGVLHQRVDRGGTATREPERDVLEADVDVGAQPGLGDPPRCRAEVLELRGGDVHVVAPALELVGCAVQAPLEHLARRRAPGRGARPRSRRSPARPPAPCPRARRRARARWPSGSLREGISAAIPPIAWAPRRWQVAASSSV